LAQRSFDEGFTTSETWSGRFTFTKNLPSNIEGSAPSRSDNSLDWKNGILEAKFKLRKASGEGEEACWN